MAKRKKSSPGPGDYEYVGEYDSPQHFPYDPGATGYDDPPPERVRWRMEREYPLTRDIVDLFASANAARAYILDESEHPFFANEGNAEDWLTHPEQAPVQLIEHVD